MENIQPGRETDKDRIFQLKRIKAHKKDNTSTHIHCNNQCLYYRQEQTDMLSHQAVGRHTCMGDGKSCEKRRYCKNQCHPE